MDISFRIFSDRDSFFFLLRDAFDEEIFQSIDTDIGSRRYSECDFFPSRFFEMTFHLFEHFWIDDIRFRKYDDFLFFCHFFTPLLEFASYDSVGFKHRLFSLTRINEMDDYMTAIYMFEKLSSKAFSVTGSFDQSWYIFDDERTSLMFHDSKIWYQSRKCIVCDLRFYIGNRLYDSGFSSVRESYKSDICDEFEFHLYLDLITHISEFSKIRCLTSTRREVSIPESSSSTRTERVFLSWACQIDDDLSCFFIGHDSSDRNFEYRILCICTMHFLCSATFTIGRFYHFCMTISYESGFVCRSFQDDISSISSVTTERSSIGNIFFSSP